jgi:four helix bundle protein
MSNKEFPMTKGGREYDLQDRLIDFAVRIMGVVEALPTTRIGNHIASQLSRSGTSSAPNYGEAQSAESRKDFLHKMKVSLKELRETHVWLLMIQRKPLIEPPEKLAPILAECDELIAIFVSSIKTAEDNRDE